jgi:Uma2 family endonuclease
MQTIEEIHHSLRLLTLEERELVASWLEGYQDEEVNVPIAVMEPKAVYAVEPPPYMTVEEYLKFEEKSPTRHEYVNGLVYAMSGASMAHNRIVSRLHIALEKHLRGGPCEAFLQDLKLKLTPDSDKFFYYPDVMVSCDRSGWYKKWITNPRLVIEVLSTSTQHIDHREKATIYRRIESIDEYVIVAQHSPQLTIYRRAEKWVPERVSGLEAMAEFRSVGASVPLGEIYEDVLDTPASE